MRISDWSSDVCSSDLQRTARPSHGEQEHRETEPGGIAATATDNFQVVTGQRIVTCNLALIERRVIMPRPDFQAHQSPPRQASSPSLCLSVRRPEERRLGKECVGTCSSRLSQFHEKK